MDSTKEYLGPEIGPKEIEKKEQIGLGSYGIVYKGKCRGKDVAIKVPHKPIKDPKILEKFKEEAKIMSKINHPNVCLFMGTCTMAGNFFIVTEYLPKGDLEKMLHDPNIQLSLYTRMKMAKDAALGMNWLHCSNPPIIHRDLKTSNLLVDENGRVKVCDFGFSQIKPVGTNLRDRETTKGTPLYMAPEVMQREEFNEKADVYSFGIVLWEILTRKQPFPHHRHYETFRHAICDEHERPEIPPDTEPSLRNLIKTCWDPEPNKRPSFKEIIDQLDHIIVDVAIHDAVGREFWKQNFLSRDEISWAEFVNALCKLLNISSISLDLIEFPSSDPNILNFKCLKALLAEKPKQLAEDRAEVVKLEKFGRMLKYFGPLVKGDQTTLNNIRELLSQDWFHGDVSKKEAKALLEFRPIGTFLIRFSSSVEGWFTLSFVGPNGSIQHQRIEHIPGSPYILHKNEKLGSLHELVAIKNLSKPCPGSKFKSIFQDLISSSRTPPSSETMTDITDNDSNQKTLFDS